MDETREHVPWLEVHERADEVEPICGQESDDDLLDCRIGLDQSFPKKKLLVRGNRMHKFGRTQGCFSTLRQYEAQRGKRYIQHTTL